jgi:protein-disulfide isomerase
VIEYLSNTCSHCAHFDATVWPQAKAKYVDTGKVKWVIREFLTPPEAISAAGFVLARCAGEARYFSVIEQIFKAQPEMFKTQAFRSTFLKIAKDAGLSEAQFEACLSDDAAYEALYARVKKAIDVDKIDGTPTVLINGKQVFNSVPTFAELDTALIAAGAQ